MRCVVVASLLLAATTMAHAQASQRRAVHGIVFDSIANAPLKGAVVQLVLADSSLRSFAATSDSAGRYRIDSLPAGKFGIGFQHPSLVALGLEPPVRAFQLFADSSLTVDLAIPSGKQVRAMRCVDSTTIVTDGMLAGYVLDGARGTTLADAMVVVSWVEIAPVNGKLQTLTRRVEAKVGDDGAFVACNLAGGTSLTLQVIRGGYREIVGELAIPESTTVRRDFFLADSAARTGRGLLGGRALHADGTPVASGHVLIPALDVDVPIENGSYSIGGIPAGTWAAEARVIGFQPMTFLVDVFESAQTTYAIALGPKVQLLDAVSVVGKASKDIRTLSDITTRGRASWGTQFLPGNSWLASATFPSDPLRAARGFVYSDMDSVTARACLGQGMQGKRMVIYLDGDRMPLGLSQVRETVPMKDILAIEAYSDWMSIPPIWRTSDACAVIAFWTKKN
ncbi:MAG: carboxypeptidase-like regulatory domain-containing protein [Gemmatimonadaceae bacterium]